MKAIKFSDYFRRHQDSLGITYPSPIIKVRAVKKGDFTGYKIRNFTRQYEVASRDYWRVEVNGDVTIYGDTEFKEFLSYIDKVFFDELDFQRSTPPKAEDTKAVRIGEDVMLQTFVPGGGSGISITSPVTGVVIYPEDSNCSTGRNPETGEFYEEGKLYSDLAFQVLFNDKATGCATVGNESLYRFVDDADNPHHANTKRVNFLILPEDMTLKSKPNYHSIMHALKKNMVIIQAPETPAGYVVTDQYEFTCKYREVLKAKPIANKPKAKKRRFF